MRRPIYCSETQALRRQAVELLIAELASGDGEKDAVSLEEAAKEFGINL